MIEVCKPGKGGLQRVRENKGNVSKVLGDVVKTASGEWLAIPLHYRNLPPSVYGKRRDAVAALCLPGRKFYSLQDL